jgi:hypothetical protein
MSPEIIVVVAMVTVIAVILAVVAWIASSALQRMRAQTREVWEDFAAETDLEVVDKEDSPNFEMRGEYDGEPMTFEITEARKHGSDYKTRTTFVETDLPQAPSGLVVFEDHHPWRWESAGEPVDLEAAPFDGQLAARAPDPLPGRQFLQNPAIREALQDVHDRSTWFFLREGRLRLRESDFVDDPERLRECADLLASTRRAVRRAADDAPRW